MTILLVERDVDFVMGLIDGLVVMDFGTKLAEGPAAVVGRRIRPSSRRIWGEPVSLLEVRDLVVAYGGIEGRRGCR
jgi:energy-coupling factor transporter ATP-binding protein EcfA2